MEHKDCGHYHCKRRERIRRFCGGLLALMILVLIVIFIVWLILKPMKPRFILQDTTVYAFNVSQPNFLTTTFQVTISSRNPNDRIGVYYERLDVYVSYRNQQITVPTLLPGSYQGHKEVTVWSPYLYGKSVPIAPYLATSLSQDQIAGLVLVYIKIDGRVKWKVGTWISGKYRLYGNCPAYITFGSKSNGVNVGESAVKYQLASRCEVDVGS